MCRPYFVDASTGCSSGFGRRLVISAISRGDRVIATARTLENIQIPPSPNLRLRQLDVTAGFEAIKVKLDEAVRIWGRIDVVVNNAGHVIYPLRPMTDGD